MIFTFKKLIKTLSILNEITISLYYCFYLVFHTINKFLIDFILNLQSVFLKKYL